MNITEPISLHNLAARLGLTSEEFTQALLQIGHAALMKKADENAQIEGYGADGNASAGQYRAAFEDMHAMAIHWAAVEKTPVGYFPDIWVVHKQ